ncbi:MAG: hypothetical protein LBQ09_00310 [Acidobacteriaceae bacterium]|jgi:hypothetical protein|nr:hypothetical protein [Acidobacteriaceae bacterium]
MAAAFVAATVPVVAHHAFGGEFDANRPVLIKGKVSKVEWVNPHAWIHIAATDVTIAGQKQDLKGATTEWAIEGGTPNTLLRRGITRDALSGSPEVIVEGYQTRDHTLQRANGRNIVFADGRKLFMGSSGTGAPADGADPAEPGRR